MSWVKGWDNFICITHLLVFHRSPNCPKLLGIHPKCHMQNITYHLTLFGLVWLWWLWYSDCGISMTKMSTTYEGAMSSLFYISLSSIFYIPVSGVVSSPLAFCYVLSIKHYIPKLISFVILIQQQQYYLIHWKPSIKQ